jgi:amino acid adenylation domain-containing protein
MELTRPVRTPNFDPDQSMVEPTANGSIANRREENSLKEAERHRILYEWNDTRTEFPAFCAHQLFEHQVQRAPEAIAVVFEDQRLSYRELNQRANQIAHYLRKLGVGPDSLVGVCMQRSTEMVAALLGVWKAGGAYVPLDPSYPQERLAFMVSDAAVQVLLTQKRCEHLFSPAHERTLFLDSDWPTIARESQSNPELLSTPSNLAYVMYTSGSTGNPKGAMILQSGLVNYLTWAIKAYAVEPGGSVPVHSSISFDLTVTSLYTPLLAGARVELVPEDAAAQSLLTALQRQKGRSLVKITPAHLELLSLQLSPGEVDNMTNVFVIGGENLLAEKLKLWRESAPATRLINEYGPTETVVGCCVYQVKPDDPRNGSVPIGRPIDNTQLYVLDPEMKPVALGEMGELYIGGAGVARGYWNRPELTAERFLPNPFSEIPGSRLYKSGDLARYRPDGVLEYLGRTDNQVKVRGYRIELGEIEAALASHPGVQSCAVLAREDEPGDRQLVGYVSAAKSNSLAPEELRSFLQQSLPSYMVPAHFVLLESLPLTPNGKVDRKSLPAPSKKTATAPAATAATRTSVEDALAAILTELLNVKNIGINVSFFDLGGDYLMVYKVVSRISDVFKVDLSADEILETPTIAGIAELLSKSDISVDLSAYSAAATLAKSDVAPLTSNGNVDQKEPVPAADPSTTLAYDAPQGETERKLTEIWAEVLNLDHVGRHDNFFDIGGHSLLALRLILRLQQVFSGEALPLRAVLEAPTVEEFAVWIGKHRAEDQTQIMVQVRKGTTKRIPFFLIHGAGGNVLSMRALAMALPDDLPVYFLQAKGLDGSEPFGSVEETAQCYVEEIRKVQPHGPYHLGGGCYGGLVAFEMARVFEQMGESVGSLFIIDVLNPAFEKYMSRSERLVRNAKFFAGRAALHSRKLLSTPANQWLDYSKGRLKAVKKYALGSDIGSPNAPLPEFPSDADWANARSAEGTRLGEILERVGRASRIAHNNFVPKPYAGDAVIIMASDRKVTPYQDDFLGWRPVVRGALGKFEIGGNHNSIFEEPAVRPMAAIIEAKLKELSAEMNLAS